MEDVTDIGTEHLPDDVVNENFVMLISNQSTNPDDRIGKTAIWTAPATFKEDGAIDYWEEWESDFDLWSADKVEFMAGMFAYWVKRLAAIARDKRSNDEEVHAEGDN